MFHVHDFVLFAFTMLLINLTPGSAFLAVASNSLRGGLRPGLLTALGAACGILIYAIIFRAGISSVLTRHLLLFNIIRYAGVGWLLFCSYRAFTSASFNVQDIKKIKPAGNFRDGLVINLLNPFTLMSFLSVIPQFADKTSNDIKDQLFFLGCWMSFSALMVNFFYAIIFSRAGGYLMQKPQFWKYLSKITGLLFLFLAVKFAFFK